jgi:hypothetical protein
MVSTQGYLWFLDCIQSSFIHVTNSGGVAPNVQPSTVLRIIIIIVYLGLSLLACAGSEFTFQKLMNLFEQLVGVLGRGISLTQAYLHTEKRGHTSVPRVGFERKIPVFEQPQTAWLLQLASLKHSLMKLWARAMDVGSGWRSEVKG